MDFTDTARIAELAPVLRAYIDEAIEIEKAGLRVHFAKDDTAYPEGTGRAAGGRPRTALGLRGADPWPPAQLAFAFSSAKLPLTRATHIDRAVPQILAGKGMHDR